MAVCAQAQTPQQWRDSVSVLMEQIRLHPNDIELRLKKAEANINLEQWDYAISEYGDVLRLDEKNLAALYFRAYCHSRQQHYDLAKVDYETFIQLDPSYLEAHLGLAHTLQKMGRKGETLDQLSIPLSFRRISDWLTPFRKWVGKGRPSTNSTDACNSSPTRPMPMQPVLPTRPNSNSTTWHSSTGMRPSA